MLKKFYENTRKPENTLGGKIMLWSMNRGHNANASWGISHLSLDKVETILDIGCGGGKNISNLLKLTKKTKIYGIDYSPASVEASIKYNKAAVNAGLVEIKEASVENIPYEAETFDCVTAFETIYFWPNIGENFKEVARVLKKGGVFLICNESQHPEGNEKWSEMLKMTIYTGAQIKELMECAGFSNIQMDEHTNHQWLCVTGKLA
ncbi:MAG: class I SAM-dependent methyltransferase [Anaerolineales bacterium]|nr:class I SAM-dependent methyltransferase [Anaerolineales bacterium]